MRLNLLTRRDTEGILTSNDNRTPLDSWDMPIENRWRGLAKGRRVLSVSLWIYCDDTSGNMSKKWNKHQSVLIIIAGLPRELAQKVFNVHFLATSNIASPLEMMEAVREQLRYVNLRS